MYPNTSIALKGAVAAASRPLGAGDESHAFGCDYRFSAGSVDALRQPVAPGVDLEVADCDGTARRSSKSAGSRNRGSRRIARGLIWIAACGVVAVSFAVTMWLTQPVRPLRPAIATLASSTISDFTTLMAAVKSAGLKGAPSVKGAIDGITRIDNERVAVKGWAIDVADPTLPLVVVVFAGGRHKLTTETDGRRPEVVSVLGVPEAAMANVSFQGTVGCRRGERLMVVAVAQSDVYGHFGARNCP
jgi:hypothetical protein